MIVRGSRQPTFRGEEKNRYVKSNGVLPRKCRLDDKYWAIKDSNYGKENTYNKRYM